jgi:hypothetical protein
MRKAIVFVACLIACAQLALAGTVTQEVSAVQRTIAPNARWTTVGNALYDITQTDLPAIISSLNAQRGGEQDALEDETVASAVAVTNGQPVVLSGLIVQLNSSGGANNATNTITLTTLGTGTNGVFFVVNTGTSNHLAVAKSGTWKSAALDVGESEAAVVVGNAAAFYGIE